MQTAQLVQLLKKRRYFPANPIGHWFDGVGSGTSWKDISGNGNHGTFSGSPTWVKAGPNRNRYGIQFAGTSDVLSCGSPALFDDLGAFTFTAWIYTTSLTVEQQIAAKLTVAVTAGWNLTIAATTGKLDFFQFAAGANNQYESVSAVTTNTWTHIAMVIPASATIASFYINGVDAGVTGITGFGTPGTDAAANFTLGNAEGVTENIAGILDDVGLWNRALTASEILTLAQTL